MQGIEGESVAFNTLYVRASWVQSTCREAAMGVSNKDDHLAETKITCTLYTRHNRKEGGGTERGKRHHAAHPVVEEGLQL